MKRLAVWLILLLAFFGLSDSVYLAKEAFSGIPLICDIAGLSGCNVVAESPYSHILGIPLADYGVAFYTLLFILAAVEVMYVQVHVRRVIQGLVALGLIASAYFIFIQLSVINALCIYCSLSALISLLVFILAYFIEPLAPRMTVIEMPPPRFRSTLVLPPPQT